MRYFLVTLVLIGVLFTLGTYSRIFSDANVESKEDSLHGFAGRWEIVEVQPAGATKDAATLVFRSDCTYSALDEKGRTLWSGTFDLDPTKSPRTWDHRTYDSMEEGGDVLGIYELEGDTLRAGCVVGVWKEGQWTGRPRPQEIRQEDADVVLELRRLKSRG